MKSRSSKAARRSPNPFAARVVATCLLATLIGGSAPAAAQAQRQPDFARLGEEAVRLTQEYLRINTTNPPGNETLAVEFFARIFTAEGIEFDSASSAPGRGNIWARLRGGNEPALVLLHHMDVVPADPRYWSVDPFAGEVRDGLLYGRGTLDTKSLGISHLMAFLALHRAGVRLNRDVIFVATADEEAGGAFGAGWLIRERPEVFQGAGFLLNEGGGGSWGGGRRSVSVEVTQKTPLWLRLTAVGMPGHGSAPRVDNSVRRLLRALDRLERHEFPPRIGPAVDAYFKALAPEAAPEWREVYADLSRAVTDRETLLRIHLEMPWAAALARNTCTVTMLRASDKVNVVPPEAQAEIDCRLLPEQDQEAFIREFEMVINDPGIRIERTLQFAPAVSSTDTPLWRAIERVTRSHFPDASLVPSVLTAFTDSHFFRDRGITAYGYSPYFLGQNETGVHGNDERISLENVRRGARLMYEVVVDLGTQR